MIFKPFYRDDSGCAAYVFGCGAQGVGAAVDPQEHEAEAYAEFARSKGVRLTHVIDTHIHADHRSGGRRLAEVTGARYCLTGRRTSHSPSSLSTTARRSRSGTHASGSCTRLATRRRASVCSSPICAEGQSRGSS